MDDILILLLARGTSNYDKWGYINCYDKNYRIKSIRVQTGGYSKIEIYAAEKTLPHVSDLELMATVEPMYTSGRYELYYEFCTSAKSLKR